MLIKITPEAVILALDALGLLDDGAKMEVVSVHVDRNYGHSIGIHLTGPTDKTEPRREGCAPYYEMQITRYDVLYRGLRSFLQHDRARQASKQAGPWATPDWARKVS